MLCHGLQMTDLRCFVGLWKGFCAESFSIRTFSSFGATALCLAEGRLCNGGIILKASLLRARGTLWKRRMLRRIERRREACMPLPPLCDLPAVFGTIYQPCSDFARIPIPCLLPIQPSGVKSSTRLVEM